jgi:flagellar hook-basal body complex protein FliE
MNVNGIMKIANNLARMQAAGGLGPVQGANFDKMFMGALDTQNNEITNSLKGIGKEGVTENSGTGMPSFNNLVGDFINSVNKQQFESNELATKFVKGEDDVELHEVMIAGEKAKTSLDLLVEIRNKAIDMYRELTRLQG